MKEATPGTGGGMGGGRKPKAGGRPPRKRGKK